MENKRKFKSVFDNEYYDPDYVGVRYKRVICNRKRRDCVAKNSLHVSDEDEERTIVHMLSKITKYLRHLIVFRNNSNKLNDPRKNKSLKLFKKLFSDKRNRNISFVNNSYFQISFLDNHGNPTTMIYPGLTHRLRALFWENTVEDPIHKNKKSIVPHEFANIVDLTRARSECPWYGKEHGTHVHAQLKKLIDLFISTFNPDDISPDVLRGILPKPDPCVTRLLKCFCVKDWIPVYSEFFIWDSSIRIATSIDLLLVSMDSMMPVLVELKTGYENEKYSDPLLFPAFENPLLRSLPNSPMNRHMLQLSVMQIILEKKYKIKIKNCYILRVLPKQKTYELHPLDSFFCTEEYKQNIYNFLSSHTS